MQEQEWHVVESLKDDIAELKETQFQVKVHEKEIQLITEVRSILTLSLSLVVLLLMMTMTHNDMWMIGGRS
jgi:hypothetical protein